MNRVLLLLSFSLCAALMSVTGQAQAQACVTNAFAGLDSDHYRPYTFVTQQKNASYVIYQEGGLDLVSGKLASGADAAFFSDRNTGEPPRPYQLFDRDQSNSRGFTVSSNGTLFVQNYSANTTETVSSPICSNNLILWFTSTRIYTLAWGSLQEHIL